MTQEELESKYLNKKVLVEGAYLCWFGFDFNAVITTTIYNYEDNKTFITILQDGCKVGETFKIDEEDLDYVLAAITVLN